MAAFLKPTARLKSSFRMDTLMPRRMCSTGSIRRFAPSSRTRGHTSSTARDRTSAAGSKRPFRSQYQGETTTYLLQATPVYEERGEIAGVTVIFQDVTRLRRYDELKSTLVTTVAHEFRTPLTSLRLAIHLCLEGAAGPLTEKQIDLLEAGRDDCQRLQNTVDELLDLARLQSGRLPLDLEPLAPVRLFKDTIAAFRAAAESRQIHLVSESSGVEDKVLADRDRILVVLSNLTSNAIRHSPKGGTVTLSARNSANTIRFQVSDAGDGIPKQYQSAIFERFFRIPGSTTSTAGLGLSLAKEIIEAHNGAIGVESDPGRGSTFWFALPTTRATVAN